VDLAIHGTIAITKPTYEVAGGGAPQVCFNSNGLLHERGQSGTAMGHERVSLSGCVASPSHPFSAARELVGVAGRYSLVTGKPESQGKFLRYLAPCAVSSEVCSPEAIISNYIVCPPWRCLMNRVGSGNHEVMELFPCLPWFAVSRASSPSLHLTHCSVCRRRRLAGKLRPC
jgi:hypothetical protein